MENSTYVSRRLLHLLFFVLLGVSTQAQQIAKGLTAGNGKYIGFYEYKPSDYKPSGEKYPLIIFLHGVGERGNGTTELSKVLAQAIPRYINKGHKMTFTWNGKKETFLVLSPQLSLSYGNWQQFYTEEMLKYAKENLNIDTNRIYLTGISLGGGGVWNYASASEANSRKFAAIAPICGTCSMSNGCNIAKANVPVWTEHAANDPTVSVNCTINANKAINACTPGVKPIEFIPPTGGHVIWNRSYDTAYVYHQPLIYEWFLGQNKSLPINKLPVAKATAPLEVNISTGTFTLSATGSTDADGTIARYGWRQISGPVTTSVQSAGSASSNVTGLTTVGTYTYELTVIDNRATWDKDTITVKGVSGPVIVPNKAPTANAGADQTITLPTNSVTLNGGASTDADGTIAAWAWTKISGPASGTFSSAGAVSTSFTGLTEGTYSVQLKITDNDGDIDLDTINVIVKPEPIIIIPNKAPTANAGADQIITLPTNSVTLNGGASTDADGTITTWAWTKISGPASGTFSNAGAVSTSFTGLTEGTYSVQLRITDNDGAIDLDTINVIVKPEPIIIIPNKAPTANAGADQTITLPSNSVTLNGVASTDADGTITTWAWTKISGPASGTFSNAAAVSTSFAGLTEGTYSVQLKITDNDGASDMDTIKVIVKPAPNKAPIANAGNDKTILTTTESVQLDASLSNDPDGSISSYNWTRINGTGTMTMTTPNNVTATVYGLSEGIHVFRVTIKDNIGAEATDEVTITVKQPENQKPVAQAGQDITIYVPESKAKLDGKASSDPDGLIVRYNWKQLSGPRTAIQSSPASAENEVSELAPGSYSFELTVTDNRNGVSRDTMNLTVINNFRYEEKLVAIPNPAVNTFKLTIYSDSNGAGIITIRDAYGRVMKQIKRDKSQPIEEENIYINDLRSGLYYLDYTIEKSKRMVTRFIKH